MSQSVLPAYGLNEDLLQLESFGSGLINHTWKVTTPDKQYILQKVNHTVFEKPDSIAQNIRLIADYLKQTMISTYGLTDETLKERFADTRDTLCYATNDNQTAVSSMLETEAHMALVIGGYNSSNTSHLVELCEQYLPTFFINHEDCLISADKIRHFNLHGHYETETAGYMPIVRPLRVLLTSGASCPDALVERIIYRLCDLMQLNPELEKEKEKILADIS